MHTDVPSPLLLSCLLLFPLSAVPLRADLDILLFDFRSFVTCVGPFSLCVLFVLWFALFLFLAVSLG